MDDKIVKTVKTGSILENENYDLYLDMDENETSDENNFTSYDNNTIDEVSAIIAKVQKYCQDRNLPIFNKDNCYDIFIRGLSK